MESLRTVCVITKMFVVKPSVAVETNGWDCSLTSLCCRCHQAAQKQQRRHHGVPMSIRPHPPTPPPPGFPSDPVHLLTLVCGAPRRCPAGHVAITCSSLQPRRSVLAGFGAAAAVTLVSTIAGSPAVAASIQLPAGGRRVRTCMRCQGYTHGVFVRSSCWKGCVLPPSACPLSSACRHAPHAQRHHPCRR